ncbi:MAG: RNA-guided endonuclease InsQ/TnpB family protein [Vulcanisaeta sp.]|uniref:RNA-guided endonuclease InsQ/TnpB family protein n=2 Tax=Vulcanisaeta sp. TaxID=2020871 RepID=UPI003D110763
MPTVGFRFRAYGDVGAVKAQLEVARELYNTLRWADVFFYNIYGIRLSRNELRELALQLRRQDPDFQQLYSQVAQNIADRLYEAKERFLRGLSGRYPRERRPGRYYSLTYPQSGWRVLSTRSIRKGRKRLMLLRLSGLGVFKVIVHRDFPISKVARVTIKLYRGGRLYVIFTVDDYEYPKLPRTGRAVGIDVGIERLITASDGWFIPNPRPLERMLDRVRRLHRALSRKVKGSRNWERARIRLARAYEHLANFRRDLYFKLGKYLALNYDAVVMEDIRVNRLIGRSNRVLRRRLMDVGFHELRGIIQWQVSKYGKEFRLVTPAYTSKTCSRCGYVKEDLTLNDRVFKCPRCGWTADRDYNAALNLLKHAGWEPPSVPVELRPLPLDILQGQGEAMKQEAPPLRTG